MNKILRNIILLLAVLPFSVMGSHFMGGSITYKLLNTVPNPVTGGALSRNFQITLTLYRDCSGITFSSAEVVNFTPQVNSPGGQTATMLSMNQVSSRDVTPLCPGQVSTCNTSPTVTFGVQELIYTGTINFDLTTPHAPITISYSSCCRNGAITNGGSNDSWYIYSYLDPNYDNSSPDFAISPVFFQSKCEAFTYNPGAVDVDGDSLAFTMANCLNAPSSSVPYVSTFSGANPLTTSCPITFDPKTGSFNLVPTMPEVAISSYKVTEYRKGKKIGEVVRDIQLQIINVSNFYPRFTYVSSGNIRKTCDGKTPLSADTTVCAGDSLSLLVESMDPDSNTLTMTSYNLPPGSTWNSISTGSNSKARARLNWRTKTNQVGTYQVSLKAEDNGCILKGSSIFSMKIIVKTCSSVPISLYSFTGKKQQRGNLIEWKVGNEYNSDFYIVERSTDGKNFTAVHRENSSRYSSVNNAYSFLDENGISRGTYYYRLKQYDIKGTYAPSQVVVVHRMDDFFNFWVYPDQEKNNIRLNFTSSVQKACVIRVYDSYGREIMSTDKEIQEGQNSIDLSTNNLAKGVYSVSIQTQDNQFTSKIIY